MSKYVLMTYLLSYASLNFAFAEATIHYEGSSTVGKYVSNASEVYKNAKFSLNVVPESSGGEQCAMRETCDLGGVARAVHQTVLDGGVVATLLGYDAIAVVVHQDNPVQRLSQAQLKDVFSGKIKNWSELGGENLPVKAFVVKEASATREVFAKIILGDTPYQNVEVATPDATMPVKVGKEKGAIGQISFSFLTGQTMVKPIVIDDQQPTVNNPNYPIKRPLYFTTKGAPRGVVKDFLEWTVSPDGQKVVKQTFVGIR